MSREAQKLIKQISKATDFVFHILLSCDPLTQNFGTEEALVLSTCMNYTCNSTQEQAKKQTSVDQQSQAPV